MISFDKVNSLELIVNSSFREYSLEWLVYFKVYKDRKKFLVLNSTALVQIMNYAL